MQIDLHDSINDKITEVSTDTFTIRRDERLVKVLKIHINNSETTISIFFSGDKNLGSLVNEFKKVIKS